MAQCYSNIQQNPEWGAQDKGVLHTRSATGNMQKVHGSMFPFLALIEWPFPSPQDITTEQEQDTGTGIGNSLRT